MRSTFKVLFYLKRTKNTPRAVYPVMGRITINGTISQFSAKINVPEQLWEVKGGRAKGKGGMGRRLMRRVGTHQPSSGQYPHPDRQTLSVDLRPRCLRHG